MVVVNREEIFLGNVNNYKQLMKELKIDNIQELVDLIIDRLWQIVIAESLRSTKTLKEVKKIYEVLHQIINSKNSNVNITNIILELESIIKRLAGVIDFDSLNTLNRTMKKIYNKTENMLFQCLVICPNYAKDFFMNHLTFVSKNISSIEYINKEYPSFFVETDGKGHKLLEKVFRAYALEIKRIKHCWGYSGNLLCYEKILSLFKHNPLFEIKSNDIKHIAEKYLSEFDDDTKINIVQDFTNYLFYDKILNAPNIITPEGLEQFLGNCDLDEKRYDLTKLFTSSIDCPAAELLDDAFSKVQLPNGNFLLIVHCSDYLSTMQPFVSIKELIENEFTVLELERKIARLSSLKAGESRNSLSHMFEIDRLGNRVKTKVVESKVKVDENLHFEDVPRIINSKDNNSKTMREHLESLRKICCLMNNQRFRKGNVKFNIDDKFLGYCIVNHMMLYVSYCNTRFFDMNNIPSHPKIAFTSPIVSKRSRIGQLREKSVFIDCFSEEDKTAIEEYFKNPYMPENDYPLIFKKKKHDNKNNVSN